MAVGNRAQTYITMEDETSGAFASFKRSLGDTGRLLSGFKAQLSGIFSVGAATAFAASTARQLEELAQAADRTGRSVQELSELQFAFRQTGASAEAVGLAMRTLSFELSKARQGGKEQLELFRALDIDVRGLNSAQEALEALAGAFPRLSDLDRLRVARELLGRGGEQLVPALKDGPERLRALREEAAGLFPVTEEAARASKDFADAVDKLTTALRGGLLPAITGILPPLTEYLERVAAARRSGAGLAQSLALGFDTADPREKLRQVNEEIAKLQQAQSTFIGRKVLDITGVLESALAQQRFLRQQVAALEQREAAAEIGNILGMTPPRPLLRLPPEAGRAAAGRRILDAEARLAETRAKLIADEERDLSQIRLRLLESFYTQGLIAERDYFDRRLQVQQEATAKTIAGIEEEIAARRQVIGRRDLSADERINAERELEEAIQRRNAAERALGSFALDNTLAAAKATRDYTDSLRELEARLLSVQGREAEALAIRQAQQNRPLRQRLETAGDAQGLANLQALERAEQAQARFNALRAQASEISQRLAIAEERVQNSLRIGAISEIEALRRTGEEREKAVRQLEQIRDAIDQTADSSGLNTLRLQAEQFAASLERLRSEADVLADKFQNIGQMAGAQFLEDLVTKPRDAAEAFRRMIDSIVRDITRLAAQDIAGKLFGSFGGGGGRGFGDLFARLFGGLFGRGGIVGFAGGGSFTVGGSGGVDSQLVAFRATPGERVTVSPAGQGRGAVNIVNHFVINGAVDARSQEQIALQVGRAVGRATRRSG